MFPCHITSVPNGQGQEAVIWPGTRTNDNNNNNNNNNNNGYFDRVTTSVTKLL